MLPLLCCAQLIRIADRSTDRRMSIEVKVGGRGGGGGGGGEGGAPIIGEERMGFVFRRWLSTALGGMRLSNPEAVPVPAAAHALQIACFVLPPLVPIVLALIDSIAVSIRIVIAAAVGVMILAITQFVSYRMRSGDGGALPPVGGAKRAALGEEEEFGFDTDVCCEPVTICRFLFPAKPNTIAVIAHAIAFGLVSAGAVYYLDLSHLKDRYTDSTAPALIAAFGWFSVALTLNPLLTRPAPELSQYRFDDSIGAVSTSLMRASYLCGFYLIDIITREISAYPPEALTTANDACHILFALMPVCWTFGVCAPPDALFGWCIEQIEVSLFGGSHAASDLRSVLRFGSSLIAVLIIFIVANSMAGTNSPALGSSAVSSLVIGLSAGLAFILSHNLFPASIESSSSAAGAKGSESSKSSKTAGNTEWAVQLVCNRPNPARSLHSNPLGLCFVVGVCRIRVRILHRVLIRALCPALPPLDWNRSPEWHLVWY